MPLDAPPPVEPPFEPPPSGLRPRSRAPWILAAIAAVVVLVAGVLWVTRRAPPPATAPVAQPVPEAAPPQQPAGAPAPATPPKLEDVSAHPLFRQGIREGEVPRRWAIVTDNVAEGVSPRKQLEFLAPSKPFSVERRDGATVIAADSYHRYDAFADAIGSVDVPTLLAVYRMMHLALESAYQALGYPGASIDAVSVRALRRILAAPVAGSHVAVAPAPGPGGMWTFVDPKLEELGAVEKHLVRMGPRNERIIQGKAREILQQLGPVRVEKPQKR